ncbi:MAG: EAL domain-containing protein [Nitriliruptoraceae bacterium]|nr:EAL domain-containing protein [Nitriliruptoraceae bacterium]
MPTSGTLLPTRVVLACVVVLTLGFLLAPDRATVRAAIVLAAIVLAAIALGVVAGVLRVRATPRADRGPWILLTLALPVFAVSDAVILRHEAVTGLPHPWPGPGHVPFQVGLLLLVVSTAAFIRRRTRPDLGSVLDAAVVAASLGVAVWVSVVAPLLRTGLDGDPASAWLLISHAALHVALVLAIARLAQLTPARLVAGMALVAGLTLLVLTSIGMGTLAVLDRYQPDVPLTVGWLLAAGGLAVAASHPSAARLTDAEPDGQERSAARQIAPHAATALVLPAVLLLSPERGDVHVIALAIAAVLLITTVRVFQLLRAVEHASRRDLADQRVRTQRRFESLVRDAADVVLVLGPDGRVDYATPAAAGFFGSDPTGWSLRSLIGAVHPTERRATTRALAERLASGDGRSIRSRVRLAAHQGRELDADLVVIDRRDDEDVGGIVFTLHETTERTQLERELRQLAYHDPLTGLPNRTLFHDRMATALARAARTGGSIAVLLCDLDDFKDVNDTLGHPAGDALLQQLGGRLSAQLRADDTLARIGGDEFAVVCENVQTTRDAVATAQRLIDAVSDGFVLEGRPLHIGMSVGVAVDRGERDAEALFRDADIALYEAKTEGKLRWCLHRASMTAATVARRQLSDDLARAVDEGRIDVAFQGIHALDDGRLVGMEALARWHHPIRGPIAPDRFITLAEQTGLIGRLGTNVLDQALEATALLRRGAGTPLRLGVNLSPLQLRDPAIVDIVLAALERHGLPPGELIIELTESAMVHDGEQVLGLLHELRANGIRLAIDDFGTGYSSLGYLRRLPVDIVKIDRSFVTEVETDPGARQLLAAIIDLSTTMGLDVVAEGIETAAQLRLLTDLGAGFAQGFWLHRPSDLDGLRRHRRQVRDGVAAEN